MSVKTTDEYIEMAAERISNAHTEFGMLQANAYATMAIAKSLMRLVDEMDAVNANLKDIYAELNSIANERRV